MLAAWALCCFGVNARILIFLLFVGLSRSLDERPVNCDGLAEDFAAVQLLLGLGKPAPVLAVHHEDDGVTVLEVVLPQRPDLGLAAHVQTVKLMCLYCTLSTLKPMVGMVVTTSPNLSLYSTVVLPALSNPSMMILAGLAGKNLSIRVEMRIPMLLL